MAESIARRTMKLILLAILAAQPAAAQLFGITAQVGSTTSAVAPGGTISVAAPAIGVATPVRITISYRGSTTATITGIDRLGAGDFTSSSVPTPLTVTSGQSFVVTFTYAPTSGVASQAQLAVSYIEPPTTPGGPAPLPSTFTITINGTAPDLVFSNAFSGGNAQAVADGDTIQFPTTSVNTTRTANFTILNRGSAVGTVATVLLRGEAFQLSGLQIPPYNINANSSLAFAITFAPTDRNPQTGTVTINYAGRDYTIRLQGTGTSANYLYTLVRSDGTTAPIAPGQSIPFPDTNIGATAALTVRVANNGNGPGTIAAISVVGAGFSATNTPFLPATLQIGAQTQLTLNFAPPSPGPHAGGLKIGDDTFDLAGTGNGPALIYSYSSGSTTNPVTPPGAVLFAPSKIGDSASLSFTVANTGNATAAINTIFLTGSSAFTLAGLPNLPFNLPPNEAATFSLRFAPAATGVSQGSLQIGGATFAVSGSAVSPDPLPQITLSGPSGPIQALQQPAYQLAIREPYSIDLVGTLNLAFSSTVFASDPAVQFASGGRTATFFIPAGFTRAAFLNNSEQVAIQTGTVAGTINIFPTFATTNGIDLTPSTVPVVALTIAPGAPQITSVSIANQTANSLSLSITGYATSRSVTQMGLTLTPASGQNLTTTSFTVPVESAFQSWYQTAPSQAAGSSFTLTIPFSLSGNATAPAQLTRAIQSIAITLTNAQGTSTPQTVTIP
jgi:hypothetical protein